jgi:hypothetical protein
MPTAADRNDELRARLLALAGHSDAYLFLNYVGDYLQVVPHDDQIRATAMRLAIDKRLFSVAEELALACPPASPSYQQLQAVAAQFAGRRTDLVDWATTDACLARNLQTLIARGTQGADLAQRIEQAGSDMPPAMTLHKACDGNVLVRAARQNGSRTWLPAAQDFAGNTEAISEEVNFRGDFVPPFLIDGVGIGWLVPRLYTATRHTYLSYSPAIYVVEPNLRALVLALRLHDWSEALADERVVITAGPEAWEEWLALMLRHDELPDPRQTLSLARWPGDQTYPAAEYARQVYERRTAMLIERRSEVEAIYAGRDEAWWARRYASASAEDPLRVLCVTSRHTTFLQHSMCDLQNALDRAGLRTQLMIETSDHTCMSGLVTMKQFKSFQPDLVVMIDHHRHEMPERFVTNVPCVCWIQDHMPKLFSVEAGQSLGPLDFTIGFGKELCVGQFGYRADRFMPCWLAVNPDKFAPPADSASVGNVPACDVVYIGHQAETPEAMHARLRDQIDSPVKHLVDAFFEEMMPCMRDPRFNGAYDLDQMLRQVEQKTRITLADDESRTRLLGVYVRPLADRVLRHTALGWVADWAENTGHTLHLYGRDWEKHPRFGKFAQGEARHGAHLGEIVRAAGITLHCGINGSLHQRVLETAVAGGFLLVRYHPHDFDPPLMQKLWEFFTHNRVVPPARIGYANLPPELADEHRKRNILVGNAVVGYVDVSEKFLREYDPAQADERRQRFAGEMFTTLKDVVFDSFASFAERAEHFLAHPQERADIVRQMQTSVRRRFTYDALVASMLTFVREGLVSTRA